MGNAPGNIPSTNGIKWNKKKSKQQFPTNIGKKKLYVIYIGKTLIYIMLKEPKELKKPRELEELKQQRKLEGAEGAKGVNGAKGIKRAK